MTFTFQDGNFLLNEHKTFLLSGEIHYFRIPRHLWARHLDAAAEAGLMAVSSYIPWNWHEPREGEVDLFGNTDPGRDLAEWFRMCQSRGLYCLVKPGPFILAEFRGAGLPDWLLSQSAEEIKMRNSRGQIVRSDGVNLFHPTYLSKVASWYDKVMPFIASQEISVGGPVILMQVCNEIGVFSWLAHQADYGGTVRELFIRWIRDQRLTLDDLNLRWGTAYASFHEIELPPDGQAPYSSRMDLARDRDWHRFWRWYYGDYLRMLTEMARARGVQVPVYHNLPGWIYGSGYEFPVNITMYEDLFRDRSEILFGVDHIPEFVSYRNMHDDRIINDITQAMQGNKPLFAAEFQSGSREFHVITHPAEMELFYKGSIANGLTGWNYYMFSQGKNPPRKGYSGDTFYWYTPLSAAGDRNGSFAMVTRINRLVRSCETVIVNAKRKAGICVLFYPPQYSTELERPADGSCERAFIPSEIRKPAYFDGLLKALQILNIDYDMLDLNAIDELQLQTYRQVWAFATDEMDENAQSILLSYIRNGGNAVIFPYLPDRDLAQQNCFLIRETLGISPAGFESVDSPLIDILGFSDIKCANPQVIYPEPLPGNATVIARTLTGNVCGFEMAVGNGTLIHLGTWIGFDTESHGSVYEKLLGMSGARLRTSWSDSKFITVRERFTDNRQALLFIGNYHPEEQSGKVHYTHPATGETIPVPFTEEDGTWPPFCAILTPVAVEVAPGLILLHSTSDILEICQYPDTLEFRLYGDRDLPGELIFEGPSASRIRVANLNGQPVSITPFGERTAIRYRHIHRQEVCLVIPLPLTNSFSSA